MHNQVNLKIQYHDSGLNPDARLDTNYHINILH